MQEEVRPRGKPLRVAAALLVPAVVLLLPEGAAGGPGPVTLLPALFAIALAFATGRTLLPLAGGVWLGAVMVAWQGGARLSAPLAGLVDAVDVFVIRNSIYDPGGPWFGPGSEAPGSLRSFNLAVIGFVFALVGMVAVAIRAGGMAGIAERFKVLARSARATRVATWGLGLAIFFDDYANTLIVGGAMRPLTDRMRISREKLAWLVDSTAAPVAGLSILSTWVAYEISQFEPQLPAAGFPDGAGYAVFLQTVPYRFYCILTLIFVGGMSVFGRDFGPMLRAEERAARTGAVFRPGARPMSAGGRIAAEAVRGAAPRAHLAVIPIAVTLVTIAWLFYRQGSAALPEGASVTLSVDSLRAVLGGVEDNTLMLFYGSLAGLGTAVALALGRGVLTPEQAFRAATSGVRAMTIAVTVLLLAWAMAAVCGAVDEGGLGTREYMASLAPRIPAIALPAGLFLLACAVSFATGSSWSTMGILLPIVIVLAAKVGEGTAVGAQGMVLITIGAVLDGSIFGDHCSPISDTTILSSTAAGSDHMDHVRTQVPYAVTVMAVALLVGYLPAAAGLGPGWGLLLGTAALAALVAVIGKRTPS